MLLERFVCGRSRSNAYVYALEDRRALLVDAGAGAAKKVIDLVEREGLEPQAIVLTHGHPDHIWTARELADRYEVSAYIHADDLPWFADPATGGQLRGARLLGRAVSRARRMRPNRIEAVTDGQVVEAGPFDVNVMHTPGHSRGSVCLAVDDLCFAGDTIFRGSIGQAIFPGGDRVSLRTSITTKLSTLPDHTRLLPGHGNETTVEAERALWSSLG